MKIFEKESGQGLVEYAIILVLVAVVVTAVLMILGPIVNNAFSAPTPTTAPDTRNEVLLSDAPRLKQGENHPYPLPVDSDGLATEFGSGCITIPVDPGFDLKIGTAVPYLKDIIITREGDNYSVCNNIPGTRVLLYIAYLPELR